MNAITIATLPAATAQAVFDQIARHLLTQNAKALEQIATDVNPACRYRGDNGTKCAAGILIADEEYTRDFERIGSWNSLVIRGYAPVDHAALIIALQHVHDGGSPSTWPADLIDVARAYELDPSVVFELRPEY